LARAAVRAARFRRALPMIQTSKSRVNLTDKTCRG